MRTACGRIIRKELREALPHNKEIKQARRRERGERERFSKTIIFAHNTRIRNLRY